MKLLTSEPRWISLLPVSSQIVFPSTSPACYLPPQTFCLLALCWFNFVCLFVCMASQLLLFCAVQMNHIYMTASHSVPEKRCVCVVVFPLRLTNRWGAAPAPNDGHYSPLSDAGARSMKLLHFSPERGREGGEKERKRGGGR